MKEKEFDRIVRELQNGKRELLKRGITFCLSGRNNATGQTWYASNREKKQPERHGRWIYSPEFKIVNNPYGHYTCDQCFVIVAFETNYCPNCGARMDGESE